MRVLATPREDAQSLRNLRVRLVFDQPELRDNAQPRGAIPQMLCAERPAFAAAQQNPASAQRQVWGGPVNST